MRMPVDYVALTRGFKPSHRGADFGWNFAHGGPRHAILAAESGVVTTVYKTSRNNYAAYLAGKERAIYGTYVAINHGGGIYTFYGHLEYNTVRVRFGDRVTKGQQIGIMGNTGTSNGTHLHFEVRKNGNKVDPLDYLKVYPGQFLSPNSALLDKIKRGEEVIIKPETADRMRDQIKVNINNLNIRSNPYLGDNIVGTLQRGIYNVFEQRDMRHEASNGYLWYRIADNVWCAQVSGVDFYKAELPEIVHPPETDLLKQEIDEMKKDFKLIFDIVNKYS